MREWGTLVIGPMAKFVDKDSKYYQWAELNVMVRCYYIDLICGIKANWMQQNGFIANLLSAQYVLGTIMPIIRSSRLYRWLWHVVHNTVKMENINHKLGGGGVLWALCYLV
jgi:hypothetical protein